MIRRSSHLASPPIPAGEVAAAVRTLSSPDGWQNWLITRKRFRGFSPAQQFWGSWSNPNSIVDATERAGLHDSDADELQPVLDQLLVLARQVGWSVRFHTMNGRSMMVAFETSTVLITDKLGANRRVMLLLDALSLVLMRQDPSYAELAVTSLEESTAADSGGYMMASVLGIDLVHEGVPTTDWKPGRTPISIARVAAMVDRAARRIEDHLLDRAATRSEGTEAAEAIKS